MPRLDFIEMTDYHHGKYLAIASETHQYAETKAITSKRKLNWDKIDLQLYKEKTAMQLRSLLDHVRVELPPEILVDRLYEILFTSADESGPAPRTGKKRQNKYPWAPHLKPYIKEIKALFHKWK